MDFTYAEQEADYHGNKFRDPTIHKYSSCEVVYMCIHNTSRYTYHDYTVHKKVL